MNQFLRRLWSSRAMRSRTPRPSASVSTRLHMLGLEDRLVPAIFTVTNTNDSGFGSLRAALNQANSTSGPDTIRFSSFFTGTPREIAISTQLSITDTVTILGAGDSFTTIRCANPTPSANNRVFNISGASTTATISGLTMTGGTVTGFGINGGGILVQADASLALDNVTLRGNRTDSTGGGIYVEGGTGTLTILNSDITNNVSSGFFATGGGISVGQSVFAGQVLIQNSNITGNSTNSGVITSGTGGGIEVGAFVPLTIIDSTIDNNSANNTGGGIYLGFGNAFVMDRSTVSNNTANANNFGGATAGGGGIYVSGTSSSSFLISNSTISGNRATNNSGGGIYFDLNSPSPVIRNSTISNNFAAGTLGGGGFANPSIFAVPITLISTVVAQNIHPTAPDIYGGTGEIDAINSFIGSGDGLTIVGTNYTAGTTANPADALLGPLQDNGGPTLTQAPLPNSPLLEAGSNPVTALSIDQRGFPRVYNSTIDIGAVELQPANILGITTNVSSVTNASTVTFTISFDQPVKTLTATNLELTALGVLNPSIVSVTAVGTGRQYIVVVNTGSDDGTIRLDIANGANLYPTVNGVPYTVGPVVQVDKTSPTVLTFSAADANPVAPGTPNINYTVQFDEPVTGLTASNFTLIRTGTVTATLGSVTTSDGGTTWNVRVNNPAGNGDLRVNFTTSTPVVDQAGNPLVGIPLTGDLYNVGSPIITGFTTTSANPTNATSLFYTLKFNRAVTGLTASNFSVTRTGTVSNPTITPTTNDGGVTWNVTLTGVSGDGNLTLNLANTTGLTPVPVIISGTDVAPTIVIDNTNPILQASSITRLDSTPTSTSTVRYALVFSEAVVGLNAANFSTPVSGLTGPSIAGITGSGRNYIVTVDVGTGSGTVGLNLVNSTLLKDLAGNPVTVVPVVGPTYTIDRSLPVPLSINRLDPSPSNSTTTVRYGVAFSEAVTGVTASNFGIATTGTVTGTSIASVTGSGASYTVTVNTGTGDGSLSLNLVNRAGIADTAGNALAATLTGQTYILDRGVPTPVSITRLDPASTNADSVRFAVQFSEQVTGVSVSNFSPIASGLTGATVLGVVGFGTSYTVTVSTGSGTGTLALSLSNPAGIVDATDNPLVGTLTGPQYIVDRVAPVPTVSLASGQAAISAADTVQFTVTFSEPVVGFTASGLVLGGSVSAAITGFSGDGTTFLVSVTRLSGLGSLGLSVQAGAAKDSAGNPSTASVGSNNVVIYNLPPTAVADVYSTPVRTSLTVAAPGVLANDSDPEGLSLTAVLIAGPSATDGTVTLAADGSFTFNPAPGFAGSTTFQYAVSDGLSLSSPTTVTITAVPKTTLTAVGAGIGGGPQVIVYNNDGSIRFNFFAYTPTFTGGVRVATGDINGDGIDDIVVGAGIGGGPHIKVYDGVTGAEVVSFFAFDPGVRGGTWLAVGDVDNDGREDIVVGAGPGGAPHVKVFSGRDFSLIKSFFAYDSSLRGGVTVAVGDVDGDGRNEIVTGAGPGGGPHVKAFRSSNLATIRSFFAFDGSYTAGVNVAVGAGGDGNPAIFVGGGSGPGVRVFGGPTQSKLVAAFDIASGSPAQGVRVATKDTNGDGRGDVLYLAPGPGDLPRVRKLTLPAIRTDGQLADYPDNFLGGLFVG